jgi:hypothetical protein
MCDHKYEIEGEILDVRFDENDLAEVVEKKAWFCYDCQAVMNTQDEVSCGADY